MWAFGDDAAAAFVDFFEASVDWICHCSCGLSFSFSQNGRRGNFDAVLADDSGGIADDGAV